MTKAGERLIGAAKEALEIARMDEPFPNAGAMLFELDALIIDQFGTRCPDHAPDCWTCKMWAARDTIALGLEP